MKPKKVILTILCIVILFGCSSLNAAEKKEYSNTLNASALIRIQADPSFLGIEGSTEFNAICKPAFQQAFHDIYSNQKTKANLSYEEAVRDGLIVSIDLLGSLEVPGLDMAVQGTINIDLDLLSGEYPLAAQEIKESFLKRLGENLNRAFEEYRQSLRDREVAFAKQVAEAEGNIKALQEALLEITGGKKMSREFLEDQITELSKQLEEVHFRIRAGEKRFELLQRQLEEAKARQREKQADDPITNVIQNKIKLLEQNLQGLKQMGDSLRVTAEKIQEIEQRLIEAQIELAERQEMAEEGPEAQRMRELKEQLTNLSLEQSEQEMRENFLLNQISVAREMLKRSTEYETLRIKADVQRDALRDSIEQLEEIRRENSLLTPPIITVISQ